MTMRLLDFCFDAIYEAGNYDYAASVLPPVVVRALESRRTSRKKFRELYEEKLNVNIPPKYFRYHANGEIDTDETLKAAAPEISPRDAFGFMIVTDAQKYIEATWAAIPKRTQLDMSTDVRFKVIRNDVLLRVYNDPHMNFIQPEAAFRQCVQNGWIDAAVRTFKPMRIQEKSCHLAQTWFDCFLDKPNSDVRLLRLLIQAKDFQMEDSSINLSFFFLGITFEELIERRNEKPMPEELRIPEIERWMNSYLASPVHDLPLTLRNVQTV